MAGTEAGDDGEVCADVRDGAADWAAADLGFQFLQPGDVEVGRVVGGQVAGVGWRFGLSRLRDCVRGCWRAVAGRNDGEVPAPCGACQQVTFQGDGAEDAPLHAQDDEREVVGAEDGGDCGELGVVGLVRGGFREAAAVG